MSIYRYLESAKNSFFENLGFLNLLLIASSAFPTTKVQIFVLSNLFRQLTLVKGSENFHTGKSKRRKITDFRDSSDTFWSHSTSDHKLWSDVLWLQKVSDECFINIYIVHLSLQIQQKAAALYRTSFTEKDLRLETTKCRICDIFPQWYSQVFWE